MVPRHLVDFPGISSRAYEHPADRSALTALRKVPYADTLLKALVGMFSERRLRLLFLASAVRVDENQLPRLHELRLEAAKRLDLPEIPELYVTADATVNAHTLGVDHPFLVLNSELVELFDDEELLFVLGHEMGHVLSGHALYNSVLFTLMRISGIGTRIPLTGLVLAGIVNALKEWSRKSELSCDRAGLLVVQDVGAATRAHMKMAGGIQIGDMDFGSFVRQGEEYASTGDARDGVARLMNMLTRTHPFASERAVELGKWVGSREYEAIRGGDYPRREDDEEASFAEEIKRAAGSYKDSWDQSEDALVKTLKDIGGGAVDLGGRVVDKVRDYVRSRDDRSADS
ncbi:MAG: M48 family metalloprotease [Streptosporangiales bacterium]|nr:M48 family metalloprotease [Streptosporangiales bacterium]